MQMIHAQAQTRKRPVKASRPAMYGLHTTKIRVIPKAGTVTFKGDERTTKTVQSSRAKLSKYNYRTTKAIKLS